MSGRLHTPELAAVEVEGTTRAAFLLRATLAAGAMYGTGAVAPFVGRALAQASGGDAAVLGFALTLEQIEAAFYAAAIKNAKLPGHLKSLATMFGKQEAEHVDTLKTTLSELGGKPPAAPRVKFRVRDRASFLKLAVALEDTGVGAYNGAGPLLRTPDLISAAGSIVQIEARHSAALRFEAGKDPAPAAFDTPLTPKQAQAAIVRAARGG
jgi:hypothetical protein